jgi:capsular polysaccharide biosynthesis protein
VEKRPDLLQAFRAAWWIVPVVLSAALGSVAYLTSGDAPPVYRTTATLAAVPHPSIRNENQVLRSIEILDRGTMVSTLSRITASRGVRSEAAARLGTALDDLLEYEVQAVAVPGTHLIRVSVQGPAPELAARFAGALAGAAGERAGTHYVAFALEVLDDAAVPAHPVGRGEGRAYAVAGLLGLLLGAGAACGVGLLRLSSAPVSRAHAADPRPTA